MKKSYGFTLAEVLITLGIIGVVAAMTIPTLMNQTSGAEFKAGFKKMVSSLNQAITMNVALNSMDFSNLSAGDTATEDTIAGMISHRMNIFEYTDQALTGFGELGNGTNYTFFFTDGMAVSFPQTGENCTTVTSTGCAMLIDVNGKKRPNQLSTAKTDSEKTSLKDQFTVRIFNQQIVPSGQYATYALYN